MQSAIDSTVKERIQSWLEGSYDVETKAEIERLLLEDPRELVNAFFKRLSFGTGGMRGLMGIGTNRMNFYTVRFATQGLASYIKKQPAPEKGHAAFIGYDVRVHSKEFAEETARVLAGNGIRVFLSKEICPTPLVSFGCRYYSCTSAVMITASHNPPQYNGYKVYWNDGGQVVPPHDKGIMEEVGQIDTPEKVELAESSSPLIHRVGDELDRLYLDAVKKLQLRRTKTPLKIVYTNLHGTGLRLVPKALHYWGYEDVCLVEKQASLDGNFSFAPSPNPEEEKALEMGTEQLLKERGDLLLATDPDADRVGIVVRKEEETIALTGHQIACICLQHICTSLPQLPENGACIKTIVTTELFTKIAKHCGITCIDVLTGFKYIAEKITEWEASFGGYQFLFGAEESYGYLFGTYVRDKDAISTSCLLAEAAAVMKEKGLTLIDALYLLYQQYGVHREALANLAFEESLEGMEKRNAFMKHLRRSPPKEVNGVPVLTIEDYLERKARHLESQKEERLELPKSDVLRYWLADQSKLVIRPSGTEPKIKIYAEVVQEKFSHLEEAITSCDARLQRLLSSIKT